MTESVSVQHTYRGDGTPLGGPSNGNRQLSLDGSPVFTQDFPVAEPQPITHPFIPTWSHSACPHRLTLLFSGAMVTGNKGRKHLWSRHNEMDFDAIRGLLLLVLLTLFVWSAVGVLKDK